MPKEAAFAAMIFLAVAGLAWADADPQDHEAKIQGIQIGDTAQQVLDRQGRMPDGRKDEKDEVIVLWKLHNHDILQVTFRKEHVSHLGLQYVNPRPTTELWLQPLYTSTAGTDLTARDPRLRVDYKVTQTGDKYRTVWEREEKGPAGYRVQVQFLSSSRKKLGDRFEDFVEFKYVGVSREDLKKFDQAMQARGQP